MPPTTIITASYDRQIMLWSVQGIVLHHVPITESQVNVMRLNAASTRLAVGGFGFVRVFNVEQALHRTGATGARAGAAHASTPAPVLATTSNALGTCNVVGLNFLSSSEGGGGGKMGEASMLCISEDGAIRLLTPRGDELHVSVDLQTKVPITSSALAMETLLLTGTQLGTVSVWLMATITGSLTPAQAADDEAVAFLRMSHLPPANADEATAPSAAGATLPGHIATTSNRDRYTAMQTLTPSVSNQAAVRSVEVHTIGCDALHRPMNFAIAAHSDGTLTILRLEKDVAPTLSESVDAAPSPVVENDTFASQLLPDESHENMDTSVNVKPSEPTHSPVHSAINAEALSALQRRYRLIPKASINAHTSYILKVVVAPHGALIATCGADCTVGLWGVAPELWEHPFYRGGSAVAPALPKPDASSTATAAVAAEVGGKGDASKNLLTKLGSVGDFKRWVWDVAFTPTGEAALMASSDCSWRLVSIPDMKTESTGTNPRSRAINACLIATP